MNVYDEAHNLAKAIKESNEYRDFDMLRSEVEKDAQLSEMMSQMQQLQIAVQTAQMTGQTPDPSTMSQFQSLYTMLAANPTAAQYLQAQLRLSVMVKDVLEILGDAINIVR
ncbi:MAG: YlbF family regulator [Firmicutes bacterium]|nr:YlbF family regulator [Bacillota bacterium]